MTNVIVTSALPLTPGQIESITASVRKKYGKNAEVTTTVDAQVIGGVQIRIGARLLDGSVAGKLAQLKQAVTA